MFQILRSPQAISDHHARTKLKRGHFAACMSHKKRLEATGVTGATEAERLGRHLLFGSLAFLLFGLFCILGGFERVLAKQAEADSEPHFLVWPYSIAYFWPLTIPLGLYFVIARWTGYNLYRYA